jgi:tripartite-type tricarboxylate transporter receptor subunit TctC
MRAVRLPKFDRACQIELWITGKSSLRRLPQGDAVPKIVKRLAIAVICAGLAFILTPGYSREEYPERRIRVVVPFPPGSQTDIVARLIADGLSRKWGQVAYVDNVAGASGNIGTTMVYRADPDGYTLLVIPPSFVINPVLFKNIPSDVTAWSALNVIGTVPYLLVARPSFQGTTIKDLIQQAEASPGKITYASGGIGSSAQLSALQIEKLAGIHMTHVPFRGAAPALADVMAGHVDIVFDALATTFPLWNGGAVKVLGIGSTSRSSVMPDVPTIAESGLPGFRSITWTAMVAPPNTPADIVAKISAATREIEQEPDVVAKLRSLNLDIQSTTPEDAAKFIAHEAGLWGKIAKDSGISLE